MVQVLLRSPVGRSSLLRNSSFLMISSVTSAVLGYAYWTVAARSATPATLGVASAAVSTFTMVSLLTNLGIGATLVQVLPRYEGTGLWLPVALGSIGATSALSAVVGLVVVTLLPVLSSHFDPFSSWNVVLLTSVGAGLTTCATGVDATFIAARSTHHHLVRNLAFAGGKLALVLLPLLLLRHMSTTAILTAWVVGLAASVGLAAAVLMPRLQPGLRGDALGAIREVLRSWRTVLAQHVTTLSAVIIASLLPPIIVARLSIHDGAFFFVAWNVGTLFMVISPTVTMSLYAEGCHGEDLGNLIRRSSAFIAALLVPAMIGCAVFGHLVLSIFGRQYAAEGATLLTVVVIAAAPDAVTNIAVAVLRVQGEVRLAAVLNASMAGVTLIGTWVLLPWMGVVGAGVAWLGAQTAGSGAVAVVHLRRRARRRAAAELVAA